MASRAVVRRQVKAAAVVAAAREHAGEVARRLAARADAEGIDFLALQLIFARALDADRKALEAADEAQIEEVRDEAAARERRDRAWAALHASLSAVRATVEGVWGAGAGERLFGVRGRTSRVPEVLRRQARIVIDRLRDEESPLPQPGGAVAVDPGAWAAALEPELAELEAAMAAVARGRRRGERTLRAKREAMAEFDRTYGAVVGLLGGLYRFARLDAYEERLRPRRSAAARRAKAAEASIGAQDRPTARTLVASPAVARRPIALIAASATAVRPARVADDASAAVAQRPPPPATASARSGSEGDGGRRRLRRGGCTAIEGKSTSWSGGWGGEVVGDRLGRGGSTVGTVVSARRSGQRSGANTKRRGRHHGSTIGTVVSTRRSGQRSDADPERSLRHPGSTVIEGGRALRSRRSRAVVGGVASELSVGGVRRYHRDRSRP